MAFSILVSALVLLTVVYFLALVTGETVVWLYNRLAEVFRARTQNQPLTV